MRMADRSSIDELSRILKEERGYRPMPVFGASTAELDRVRQEARTRELKAILDRLSKLERGSPRDNFSSSGTTAMAGPMLEIKEKSVQERCMELAALTPGDDIVETAKRVEAYLYPVVTFNPDMKCGCYMCTSRFSPYELGTRMIVCEICGNKRCPHAENHENACTHSNEPGQSAHS